MAGRGGQDKSGVLRSQAAVKGMTAAGRAFFGSSHNFFTGALDGPRRNRDDSSQVLLCRVCSERPNPMWFSRR